MPRVAGTRRYMASLSQLHCIKFVITACIVCGFIIYGATTVALVPAFLVTVGSFYSGSVEASEMGKPVVTTESGTQATFEEGELFVDLLRVFYGLMAVGFILICVVVCICIHQCRSRRIQPQDVVCVIAADEDTLSSIAKQVRQATGDFYPVEEHLVTNRKAVAKLPIYTRAICCVRNAGRTISFSNKGAPEPDADLGFHAFNKMAPNSSTDTSGVIIILVDHANSSQDSSNSELCSMEDATLKILSPRLQELADSDRFFTVDKKLNEKQKEQLREIYAKAKH